MKNPDFNRYKEYADSHLTDFLPTMEDHYADRLTEAMRYSLEAGGKRLRPALLMGACEFAGGSIDSILVYACAIEYIHTYSLIHDDLPCMDDDDLRRGKPTNHAVYGEATALLAGDGLLTEAFEMMIKDALMYLDNTDELKKRVRAINEIAKGAGCTGMIAGQMADLENNNEECSRDNLEFINLNKTAKMIIGSLRAGAQLGNASAQMLSDLTDYGEAIGIAFQICDDILDISSTVEELGKPIGSDEQQGKSTYPHIYGIEESRRMLAELTQQAVAVLEPYGERADFLIDLAHELETRTK